MELSEAPQLGSSRPTCLGIAFVGPANPTLFKQADTSTTLRPLRLQSTPPTPSDMPAGEVRAYEPFRQEDAERALEGASALVLGLPVPVPPATLVQERVRDTQSFVVDGLIAAAHSRGIHHVAVVAPHRAATKSEDKSSLDELGRIVRSYGMDVLDVPRAETPNLREAVARWLGRCARLPREGKLAQIRPQDLVVRKPGTGRSMRSLQRLPLPRGWDAERMALAYPAWIGASFPWVLRTEVDPDGSFRILSTVSRAPLLDLRAVTRLNGARRRVFLVRGGTLAADAETMDGWLEFRVLPGAREAIAAVGDFVPRLPWYLYRMTQAPAHELIMAGFANHLKHLAG